MAGNGNNEKKEVAIHHFFSCCPTCKLDMGRCDCLLNQTEPNQRFVVYALALRGAETVISSHFFGHFLVISLLNLAMLSRFCLSTIAT